MSILNHPQTQQFLNQIIFWDAKRPITKKVLNRIDIAALIAHLSPDSLRSMTRDLLYKLQTPSEHISDVEYDTAIRRYGERLNVPPR
ncbi:MAG: hypothetical protein D6711_16350 [Chloroflexi bacterium]|nr:MAG: hypothetical protein D6711_16350 [Chloroflexota bacterium]